MTASVEEALAAEAAAASDEDEGRGIDSSMHRSSPSFILLLLLRRDGENGRSARGLERAEEVEEVEQSALGGDARRSVLIIFRF